MPVTAVSLVVASVVLGVCTRASAHPADMSREELLAHYAYDSGAVSFNLRPLPPWRGVPQLQVTFNSQVGSEYPENQRVPCVVYGLDAESGGVARRPAVVVLDVWKTTHGNLSRDLSKWLVDHGMIALAVPLPYHQARTPPGFHSGDLMITGDPEQTARSIIQAVVDVRCAVDWLQRRPEVDGQRVGLVGISLGAIVGLIAAQVEPRISVAVSLLGCGAPAQLVLRSPLAYYVRRDLRRRGFGEQELRDACRVIDVRNLAGSNPRLKLLMINGRFDEVLPRGTVEATWRALGKPDLVWLGSGHYSAFLYQGETFKLISDYLLAQFMGRAWRPRTPLSAAIRLGIVYGHHSGLMGGLLVDALPLDRHGLTAATIGWTTRGPLVGLSARLGAFVSVGYGLRPLGDDGRGEVFGSVQITF